MDATSDTLLLTRSDVECPLTLDEWIAAVEDAFRMHALGKAGEPRPFLLQRMIIRA